MKSLRVGIAGLGTVGAGVVQLLQEHRHMLAARAGCPIEIVAVSARNRRKRRNINLKGIRWVGDARHLARDPDIDVVVETIGGTKIAREVCRAALQSGKSVVTANKALLALEGTELARLAEKSGVQLSFEAAVAGGIPIMKALREGLAGNAISRVYGILNGTCNYILTEMRTTGRDFDVVLAEAQGLGYAEADPSFDIDGIDAAHKLSVLASLTFNTFVDFKSVLVEGIRRVSAVDIAYAEEFGLRIKLLGIARRTPQGIEQSVYPCLVPTNTPIAHVDGVFNAVVAEGDQAGRSVFEGRGAGAGPTASAVVADLVDIAAGRRSYPFGVPVAKLSRAKPADIGSHCGRYYMRIMVKDRPGVIADLSAVLRDEHISIESLLQRGRSDEKGVAVPVVLITHETRWSAIDKAINKIMRLKAVVERPHLIRIEQL